MNAMKDYLVFGGTTEGRQIADRLLDAGENVVLCVATEYGEEVLLRHKNLSVHQGRLDLKGMLSVLSSRKWKMIIDATHPYAVLASENIKKACEMTGQEYIRLLRKQEDREENSHVHCVDSMEEATDYLNQTEGNILFTTGAKDLPFYTSRIKDLSRMYVRILADGETVSRCRELGLTGRQIICMQGPFSQELNAATLRQIQASFLVTKDTGRTGGLPQKLEGAKMADAEVVLIRRPEEEEGDTMETLLERLSISNCAARDSEHTSEEQTVTLLGIGMGGLQDLTIEGKNACQRADVILGASRMIRALARFAKETEAIYRPEQVAQYIKNHHEKKNIVVAFSGDVGFYSGTKKLLDLLREELVHTELIPGISSVVYFASRLQIPWEDVKLISIHGRKQNLIGAVRSHRKVFSLAGYAESIRSLCQELTDYGLSHVRLSVGCQLGYPEEQVRVGTPEQLCSFDGEGLCVVLIENEQAEQHVITHGLPDETFERGNAPMTKEEIRSISLSKLMLTKNAVVYDVGAGTGSIGLECARMAVDGVIYAIEKKPDALELLDKNRRKLGITNLEIVAGLAPEALRELPAPTHAFIGGSSGNMKEIIEELTAKNPNVRIVINCIALETVAEVMQILREKKFLHQDIVHAAIGKSKNLSNYHMMMGQNPVYVITLQGECL